MREAGAEPPDHRTRSAGVETGEASRRTSQHRSSKCAALGCCPIRTAPSPGDTGGGGLYGRGLCRRSLIYLVNTTTPHIWLSSHKQQHVSEGGYQTRCVYGGCS